MDVIRPRIDERTYLGTDKSVPYNTCHTKRTNGKITNGKRTNEKIRTLS
ncbi:MAG: hypothetical protein FWG87_13825 [Defluviitaleaceae bacterium]|nr:hypothetical protein [Defluviitaleaceae bacterium]